MKVVLGSSQVRSSPFIFFITKKKKKEIKSVTNQGLNLME